MEEKKDILSKFESFKNNEPYKVPENYFDTLLSRVQDKIDVKNKSSKKIELETLYKFIIKISFLTVGIIFIIFISFKTLSPFWQNKQNFNKETDEVAIILIARFSLLMI